MGKVMSWDVGFQLVKLAMGKVNTIMKDAMIKHQEGEKY